MLAGQQAVFLVLDLLARLVGLPALQAQIPDDLSTVVVRRMRFGDDEALDLGGVDDSRDENM